MMGALAPEAGVRALSSLADLAAGIAWTDLAEPLVRERVEAAARQGLPAARALDLPLPPGEVGAVFRREVAEVHEELFTAERARYGENVRIKVEQCLELADEEYELGLRARSEYAELMAAACEGVDLLVTPTLGFVAPGVDRGDLEIREAVIRFTFPFNALGWPALALPCGIAEWGLPASIQLVSPRGDDALVLAAGELLERALAG
jgi:aspartyl-tRNA(Asn)/glutamyl-tRNA(Gln) amidotransferase subunit A